MMNRNPASDEFRDALTASIKDHVQRRAQATVEVRKTGFLRWEWRFYWGRYKRVPGWERWYDYEEGHAFTRQGALFAAARQLTKVQLADAQWQTIHQTDGN